MVAASSSSLGMPWKNCRSRKTPKPLATVGMIRAEIGVGEAELGEPDEQRHEVMWIGTRMVARMRKKSHCCPRNRIWAKAYAAGTLIRDRGPSPPAATTRLFSPQATSRYFWKSRRSSRG